MPPVFREVLELDRFLMEYKRNTRTTTNPKTFIQICDAILSLQIINKKHDFRSPPQKREK